MATAAKTRGHGKLALCGAKKKQGEGTCTQVAGWGTPNDSGPCKLHGGATRTHRKAAQKEQARQACAILGIGRDDAVDPAEALMREVARTQYAIEWYEHTMAALPLEQAEAIDANRELWMVERKHLGDVTKKALDAGVARRQIEMLEDLARQVVAGFSHFARLMGLDPASPQVREAGRQALQLVAGERA